jgi:hypothetical protein
MEEGAPGLQSGAGPHCQTLASRDGGGGGAHVARCWCVLRQGFTMAFLKSLVPMFGEKTRRLLEVLSWHATGPEGERVVGMHLLCTQLTLEIICKASLLEDMDILGEETPHPVYPAFMR